MHSNFDAGKIISSGKFGSVNQNISDGIRSVLVLVRCRVFGCVDAGSVENLP